MLDAQGIEWFSLVCFPLSNVIRCRVQWFLTKANCRDIRNNKSSSISFRNFQCLSDIFQYTTKIYAMRAHTYTQIVVRIKCTPVNCSKIFESIWKSWSCARPHYKLLSLSFSLKLTIFIIIICFENFDDDHFTQYNSIIFAIEAIALRRNAMWLPWLD